MAQDPQTAADKLDDEHYPAYTMGRAAEMLGTTPGFLRSLDEVKLLVPQRSPGGHRRYSRYQLRLAARVRELVDHGTPLVGQGQAAGGQLGVRCGVGHVSLPGRSGWSW